MILLEGKKVADTIKAKLAEQIASETIVPCLAIIQIGNDERSTLYIKNKKTFGQAIGATVRHITLASESTQADVEQCITELNHGETVHGIILQLPIPDHLNRERLLAMIERVKDVDGLSSSTPLYTPATARGIMSLLKAYDIEVHGKKVVVIGTSRLVGAPTADCLEVHGASVVRCNKQTVDIPHLTKAADIIIVAAGSPGLLTEAYVREGQVVIDVGITRVRNTDDDVSYITGDVDFQHVSTIVRAISPVPGGVGPLTVASLFENLFDAFQRLRDKVGV